MRKWTIVAGVITVIAVAGGAALTHLWDGWTPTKAHERPTVVQMQIVKSNAGKTYTLILVPVFVNGHGPYRFLFDTGCSNCIMARDLANKTGIKTTPTKSTAVAFGTGELMSVGTADSLSVGAAPVQNMPVDVLDFSSYRRNMDSHFDGIIGYDYMRHFKVTLDFAQGRLLLEEPRHLP